MRDRLIGALRTAKRNAWTAAGRAGVLERVAASRWRQQRLLVVGYHGVALEDEHRWSPSLYVSQSLLRRRFELLKSAGCRVVPLNEGIERLYANDLPPRAVALTFDDGYHDFYEAAWPLLREFNYPATVYLATLRCDHNLPVFNLVVPFLLWRQRGRTCECRDGDLGVFDLRSAGGRAEAWQRIRHMAVRLGPERKHALAQRVSDAIGGDYQAITQRRLLTIMRPEDVTRLASEGLDVQLHTHQHRTPRDRAAFRDEIERNRQRISELTGRIPTHFCYPSGLYAPEFLPWLTETGVVSATTCDPGIATPMSERLLIPRLVDHEGLSESEFEAWLTGLPSLIARKATAYRKRPSSRAGHEHA
jgi:peptidoglycan/xylan/chitin deacetylase (PgdA/CDA1 family)